MYRPWFYRNLIDPLTGNEPAFTRRGSGDSGPSFPGFGGGYGGGVGTGTGQGTGPGSTLNAGPQAGNQTGGGFEWPNIPNIPDITGVPGAGVPGGNPEAAPPDREIVWNEERGEWGFTDESGRWQSRGFPPGQSGDPQGGNEGGGGQQPNQDGAYINGINGPIWVPGLDPNSPVAVDPGPGFGVGAPGGENMRPGDFGKWVLSDLGIPGLGGGGATGPYSDFVANTPVIGKAVSAIPGANIVGGLLDLAIGDDSRDLQIQHAANAGQDRLQLARDIINNALPLDVPRNTYLGEGVSTPMLELRGSPPSDYGEWSLLDEAVDAWWKAHPELGGDGLGPTPQRASIGLIPGSDEDVANAIANDMLEFFRVEYPELFSETPGEGYLIGDSYWRNLYGELTGGGLYSDMAYDTWSTSPWGDWSDAIRDIG